MTTFTLLSTTLPFQFSATFDGASYSVNVTWNVSGQRPYVGVYDGSNTCIVYTPMIASPDSYDINLVGGFFSASTLVFRATTQQFEVSP